MQLLFVNQLGGHALIKAICWMLVHSLWQGLILAVAGGIVILFTKRHNASLRYNLLSGLFLLFIISACFTFISQFNEINLQDGSATNPATQLETRTASLSQNLDVTLRQFSDRYIKEFVAYFDNNATSVVLFWFIIFITRLVKILSGLSYIRYIRHRKLTSPPDHWRLRIQELKAILKISKPLVMMESGIIKVPMVVGWLRPVILIPMGLLTQLGPHQMEAILLHELAHIKRRDYFVNMVQSFAEIIFFFNPAVLWISSLIREERENCCDDLALTITNSKAKFIDALVSFQEYNSSARYALAFPGRKNQLLKRVQRIIYNTNNTLDKTGRAFMLSCCLVIAFLCAAIVPSGHRSTIHGAPTVYNRLVSTGSVLTVVRGKEDAGSLPTDSVRQTSNPSSPRELKASLKPGSSEKTAAAAGSPEEIQIFLKQQSDTIPASNQISRSGKGILLAADIKISAHSKLDFSYDVHFKDLSESKQSIDVLKDQKTLKNVLSKIAAMGLKLNLSTPDYKADSSINARPHQHPTPDPHNKELATPLAIELINRNNIQVHFRTAATISINLND